jgi:hypothetical protein
VERVQRQASVQRVEREQLAERVEPVELVERVQLEPKGGAENLRDKASVSE